MEQKEVTRVVGIFSICAASLGFVASANAAVIDATYEGGELFSFDTSDPTAPVYGPSMARDLTVNFIFDTDRQTVTAFSFHSLEANVSGSMTVTEAPYDLTADKDVGGGIDNLWTFAFRPPLTIETPQGMFESAIESTYLFVSYDGVEWYEQMWDADMSALEVYNREEGNDFVLSLGSNTTFSITQVTEPPALALLGVGLLGLGIKARKKRGEAA